MKNMTAILEQFHPAEVENVRSEKAKAFVKLLILQEQIEIELKSNFSTLTEEDKRESFQTIKRLFSMPDTVTVKDAAKIIGVTPQRVRTLCASGHLNAQQTMEGSGKWSIEPSQLMKYPGWAKYVEERRQIATQSRNIARFMKDNLHILNDDTEE
ncbi:MerR family transcriptional regulator [Metabacillus indicus]|uniref:Helix-turn-helix domain-containing protein n=1 Tax=Metabacillus indicus TaxID=246786 RepID=A0A084GXS2_METID|nr:DNA-binding protein [Metabacillus indicus]KEZ52134.1 hypothetical protein GS18_0213705 [Metabacillus indicus]